MRGDECGVEEASDWQSEEYFIKVLNEFTVYDG